MAFLCDDVDLLLLEPTVFGLVEAAPMARLKDQPATLTGTALVLSSGSLLDAGAAPGMVFTVATTAGVALPAVEIVTVTDATHAMVSVPRSRRSDTAVPPIESGAVKVTLISFRPQIAAISDELLGLLGVPADPALPDRAISDEHALRSAAVFGTLATLFRLANASTNTNINIPTKLAAYEQAYQAMRRSISAKVDRDGDGIPETRVAAGVRTLTRG